MSVSVNPDHVLQMSNVQVAFKEIRTAGYRAAQPGADPDAYVQAQWNTTAAILEAGGMPVTVTRGEDPLDQEEAEARVILADTMSALFAKVSFIGNQPGITAEQKRWLAVQLNDFTETLNHTELNDFTEKLADPQMVVDKACQTQAFEKTDSEHDMDVVLRPRVQVGNPGPADPAAGGAGAGPQMAPPAKTEDEEDTEDEDMPDPDPAAGAGPAVPVVYDLVSDSD